MVPDALAIAALVLAIIDQAIARGRSLVTWAVILVCVAMLWHIIAK